MLSRVTPAIERERGLEKFLVDLHRKKLNAYFIGRTNFNYPFYMATSRPVKSLKDLSGKKAAASPLTTAFTDALGMTPIETEDEYTAMERGLVNAVIMPAVQHGDMSMYELESHFIDHGVLSGNVVLLLNWDKYAALPQHLKDLMLQARLDLEPKMVALTNKWTMDGRAAARKAGLTIVKFSPKEAEAYVDLSFSSSWENAKPTLSPESYNRMKEFLKK
jgi:TRAP-type C4-dicarboxylate transport system substrate-binding protein